MAIIRQLPDGGSNLLHLSETIINISIFQEYFYIFRRDQIYTVYVLYSKKFNKIYVGFTFDLKQRLLSHNELAKKGWTINYRPWKLIHEEKFTEKKLAMKREIELKSHKGRDFIRKLIK